MTALDYICAWFAAFIVVAIYFNVKMHMFFKKYEEREKRKFSNQYKNMFK